MCVYDTLPVSEGVEPGPPRPRPSLCAKQPWTPRKRESSFDQGRQKGRHQAGSGEAGRTWAERCGKVPVSKSTQRNVEAESRAATRLVLTVTPLVNLARRCDGGNWESRCVRDKASRLVPALPLVII